MQILSYSPSVEAYALVGKDRRPVDLSRDITSCTVNRKVDAASQFSITLQNKGWKYNGLFSPMDPIVIYSTKSGRQKLFTGYITSMDAYRLYQSDFNISGFCPIYRLQNLYWDPILYESQMLVRADAYRNGKQDNGYAMVASRLLETVGGMSADAIHIQENIPEDALKFAQDMYQANLDSANQLRSMVDDFYSALQTHGPKAGAIAMSSAEGADSALDTAKSIWKLYTSWLGKFDYSGKKGRLDPVKSGYGDCSSTIWRAYQDVAGIDVGEWVSDMLTKGEKIAEGKGDLPLDKMQVADLVIMNHKFYSFHKQWDHVELYGGNGQLAGHPNLGKKGPRLVDANEYMKEQVEWQVRRHLTSTGEGEVGNVVYSGPMSEDQKKIVRKASDGSVSGTPGYCAQWVSHVWSACGFPYPSGDAIDFWNQWKSTGSTNIATAPPGAVMCGSGSGSAGSLYGHVGIRLTGDKVASLTNGSTATIETVSSFYSWQTATCQGHKGAIGWCVPPGPKFSKK